MITRQEQKTQNKLKKVRKKVEKAIKEKTVEVKVDGMVKEYEPGMEPKAVKPDKGEVEAIIKEKKKASIHERLQRQRNFRYVVRDMILHRCELEELQDQISGIKDIAILWEGMRCPKKILTAKYHLKRETYRNLQQTAQYLQQSLRNDGLSDKELDKVMEGEYVKDEQRLDKLGD